MGKKLQLPDEPIRIAGLLEEEREKRGFTLAELGKKSGVDVGQLSKFCNGHFRTLSTNLQKVLDELQICWPPPVLEAERDIERSEQVKQSVPLSEPVPSNLLKEIEIGWVRAGPRREAFEKALVAVAKVFE